ncbi:DUF6624 domain-containing protein [Chryseobacterium limigenitum]|uniref:Uncharacterized protein n=1 Tax=Chryseobacterium limigenitum TaxID=1612149 RepID=A0A1K2ITY5_9FLAO|nr:DUF6624 domain-containing protein [Chryseobacterium limigenitum]SFZ95897.1 hypothetical protein SAMN05216324_113106 [Chryseobacterium limigenitum]
MNIKLNHIALILCLCFFGCKKTENYSEVRKTLEKVLVEDQMYRNPVFNSEKQTPIDRKNMQIVTKIIDSLGWLGEDKIGKDANLAFFAVIQHAPELSTMEKYLAVMKDAVKKGNAEKSRLAYLIDRVEILNNRNQIYGTQYSIRENGEIYIGNLIDSSNVDSRRKSMNLEPIKDYLKGLDSLDYVNDRKKNR